MACRLMQVGDHIREQLNTLCIQLIMYMCVCVRARACVCVYMSLCAYSNVVIRGVYAEPG